MPEYKIEVAQHKKTGLLMAQSPDLEGYIVHGHDEHELMAKLVPAFKSFMKAIGQPVGDVELRETSDPGYFPPTYIARAQLEKAA